LLDGANTVLYKFTSGDSKQQMGSVGRPHLRGTPSPLCFRDQSCFTEVPQVNVDPLQMILQRKRFGERLS